MTNISQNNENIKWWIEVGYHIRFYPRFFSKTIIASFFHKDWKKKLRLSLSLNIIIYYTFIILLLYFYYTFIILYYTFILNKL